MSWSDLGNMALVAQAVFFIVSVWFLWLELRENTKLTRARNVQSLVDISIPFHIEIVKDRELNELCLRGSQNFEKLDQVDQNRYLQLMVWWMIFYENIYYQWKNNFLEYESYKPWESYILYFMRTQKLHLHWDKIKENFQGSFVAYMDDMLKSDKLLLESQK
ncbi:hypothetical protein JW935_21815 [candidate division KSB1 bacterium]|nr:hypothetical protein [candidate division KSB1 bacterium]